MDLFRDVDVRLAESTDASAIASLLAASFSEYQPLYTAEGYAATVITEEQIVERIGQGPVWVALSDEIVVGTVSVVAKGHSLYVRGMAVRPTARGQRIGERLLREVESFAIGGEFRRLFLSTTPFLHRAKSLYERIGFQRTDEEPHELFGTPLFTMEKFLPDKP
jgi:N-acetylglutamate synthase-like GNAT family acetyltransferase